MADRFFPLLAGFLGAAVLMAGFPTGMCRAEASEACLACHGKESNASELRISPARYEASVHGDTLTCRDCHAGVVGDAHMTTPGSGRVDCRECHEQENRHGPGQDNGSPRRRPACHSCHTRHGILSAEDAASSVHPDHLPETCGGCHPAQAGQARLIEWLPSVQIRSHGKQDFACDRDPEDCVGCHQGRGAHGETAPIADRDCWKCHLPEPDRAGLLGRVHPLPSKKSGAISFLISLVYAAAVLLVLLGALRFYSHRISRKAWRRN